MTTPDNVTVDIHQIAEMANVGRTAVSNWRRRHPDFPRSDAAGRFDLEKVRRWLIEQDKMPAAPNPEIELWALFDSLRSSPLSPTTATDLVVALLVYLEACDRGDSPTAQVRVEAASSTLWPEVREARGTLHARLVNAARTLERDNQVLSGLLAEPIERGADVDESVLLQLVDLLQQVAHQTPSWELFEEVVGAATKADRFRGDRSTPDDIAELMVRIGGTSAEVVGDPAAGEGGLLLSAAIHPERMDPPSSVIGYDINEEGVRTARSRFFLYDVPAEIQCTDVFTVPQAELPAADLVLLDPPLGPHRWGSAEVMMDLRWRFGAPPAERGDLAWLQLAHQMLRPGGRTVVCSSHNSLFRSGREVDIRRAMLEAGVVEAIIALPGRLRLNTSIPLAIWTLRKPAPDTWRPKHVLFVDGTNLGTTGRSQHTFEESDIERIARCVRTFATDESDPDDPEIAWAIPLSDVDAADLDPLRYRPAAAVADPEHLADRKHELRKAIRGTKARLDEALGRIVSRQREFDR